MNDRFLVEMIHGSHDAILEFLFGSDTDVAQDGAGKFGKEALDQIQPGAVLGREGELEAARSGGEPCVRLFGDEGGMIVEDQADGRVSWIGGIDQLEKVDELAASVAVHDQGVYLAGEEIDAGQQADRAVALVFELTRDG